MTGPHRNVSPARLALALAAALFFVMVPTAARAAEPVQEDFHYHWELRNLLGVLAGLFFPSHGEGELTFKTSPGGHLLSELQITSSASAEGEFWRYGAEIEPEHLQPIRAWSAYKWRGRSNSKNEEVRQQGVMDIVSAIYSLRRDPPDKQRRLEIWSDGNLYPVVVLPLGAERLQVGGRTVETHHFSTRGVDVPDRRKWKGKLDLWLAGDAAATPVVIQISRALADVRLELDAPPPLKGPGARPAEPSRGSGSGPGHP